MERSKKIRDIEPIEFSGDMVEGQSFEELIQYIEQPVLDACSFLYEMNIRTIMSSANRKDVGDFAYIDIDFETLSEENQTVALRMSNDEQLMDLVEINGYGQNRTDNKRVKIKFSVNANTTLGEVSDYFMMICRNFRYQDILYHCGTYEETCDFFCKMFGMGYTDFTDRTLLSFGAVYREDTNKYYWSDVVLKKHDKYMLFKNGARVDVKVGKK